MHNNYRIKLEIITEIIYFFLNSNFVLKKNYFFLNSNLSYRLLIYFGIKILNRRKILNIYDQWCVNI